MVPYPQADLFHDTTKDFDITLDEVEIWGCRCSIWWRRQQITRLLKLE